MIEYIYISKVYGLELEKQSTCYPFPELGILTNSMSHFYEIITNKFGIDALPHVMTKFEIEGFKKGGTYFIGYCNTNTPFVVHQASILANYYLSLFWLLFDNSISNPISHFLSFQGEAYHNHNTLDFRLTNSEGLRSSITLSDSEIKKYYEYSGTEVLRLLTPNPTTQPIKQGLFVTSSIYDIDVNALTRLQRSFLFLSSARRNSTIIIKITNYISALECLFTTKGKTTEVVCRRSTYFIAKNADDNEKKQIMDTLIFGYHFRSMFLHGLKLDSDLWDKEKLRVSTGLDNILRRILLKILNEKYAQFFVADNSKGIEELFSNIIPKDDKLFYVYKF